MAIPSRVRERLLSAGESQIIVTVHVTDPCLLLYPLSEFEMLERKLSQLPTGSVQSRLWQRLLVGHASECEPDGHGRILIPAQLRKHAGMSKQLVMIGQVNRLEIWDEATWEQKRDAWLDEAVSGEVELPAELEGLAL